MSSWKYSAYRLFWCGLDSLFPPVCGGCGTGGQRWCKNCQDSVHPISGALCETCGVPLETPGRCLNCQQAPSPPYQALRSWLVFEGCIRHALHRIKYHRDLGLGDALAVPLSGFVANLGWPIEFIVPVPLGEKRRQERGYNQVGLLAWPLAMRLGWRYEPRALARTRETASQVGLSASARKENVLDAFRADPRLVCGHTVLVMDDVATTGATLGASAQALREAGASQVYALTIARALSRHDLNDV